MLYQTEKEGIHEQRVAEKGRGMGLPVEQLNPLEIKKVGPHVDIKALGAFHDLCDGHTIPPQFMN